MLQYSTFIQIYVLYNIDVPEIYLQQMKRNSAWLNGKQKKSIGMGSIRGNEYVDCLDLSTTAKRRIRRLFVYFYLIRGYYNSGSIRP